LEKGLFECDPVDDRDIEVAATLGGAPPSGSLGFCAKNEGGDGDVEMAEIEGEGG
jgi:hypothetical protein